MRDYIMGSQYIECSMWDYIMSSQYIECSVRDYIMSSQYIECSVRDYIMGSQYIESSMWDDIMVSQYIECSMWDYIMVSQYIECSMRDYIMGSQYIECSVRDYIMGSQYIECSMWDYIMSSQYIECSVQDYIMGSQYIECSVRDYIMGSQYIECSMWDDIMIIGRTGILRFDQRSITLTKANPVKGTFYLPIVFTSYFGPAPKMIGYILLNNGAMAADRLRFTVERCFPNRVTLKFPVREAAPKSVLNLRMEALANSVCALRVVDKSVQISYTDQELTLDKVYSLFQSERSGYDYRVDETSSVPCWKMYSFDRPWIWNQNTDFMDILSLFKDVGVKILTNALIQKPPDLSCALDTDELPDAIRFMELAFGYSPQTTPDLSNKVRQFFPETWLWKLVVIGKTGQADLKVTVPDTITDWSASVFCTGPSGFGLSAPTYVRAFQPFFVEMSLPYSVALGELFTLKASVFNYLKDCIKVTFSLCLSHSR
ncbi:alpha-2-macroglobulin 1 [Pelobates cultripes]|uniref:Alpha-2-macroglobulin 1 n=1 Tax=Pelobates cultripes TaxID=61616 RepID=A0AAD1WTJ9_PELCU|nr:alpha-2-macroglobulin 1 [Pelobates cultripes]